MRSPSLRPFQYNRNFSLLESINYLVRLCPACKDHFQVEFIGKPDGGPDVIGDLKFEYISILDNQDQALCRLGIAEDGRLVCKSFFGMTAFGPGITDEIFSNEKEINGVMVPMETRRLMNGQEFGIETVTEFVINPELTDGSFGKPE